MNIEYLFIPYIIFSLLSLFTAFFAYNISLGKFVFFTLLLSVGYYLLKFPKIYLGFGMVTAIVFCIQHSFSDHFKKKDNFMLDMMDIVAMIFSSLLSTLFWSIHLMMFVAEKTKKADSN